MKKQVQIEKLKRQLGLTDDSQDFLLEDLFDDWAEIACEICNRKEPTAAMLAIIRDTAAAAWRRRGGEGMTGYNTGNQSYSFETLRQEMFNRLIQAGQRIFK